MGSYSGYGGASSSGGKYGAGGSAGAFNPGGLGVVSGTTWNGTKGHFNSAGGLQGFSNAAVDKGWNTGYGQADSSFGAAGLSGADSVGFDGIGKTAGSFDANIPGGNTPKNTLNKNGKLKRKYRVAPPTLTPPTIAPPPTIQPTLAPPKYAPYSGWIDPYVQAIGYSPSNLKGNLGASAYSVYDNPSLGTPGFGDFGLGEYSSGSNWSGKGNGY